MKPNDAIIKNMQTNMTSLTNSNLELKNMFRQFMKMNTASSSDSRTLPGNIITNPKEDLKGITTRRGTAYPGPTIPTTSSSLVVKRKTEATKDTVHPTNNGSTEDVQPPVVLTESPISTSEPVNSPIIKPIASPVSAPRPNQRPSIPYPLRLQDQKLPLADLSASINIMPLSVWNKLSLPDLSPMCMTLELADRLISHPVGVAKDVFVKVGTFHFSADFVVVDFDADPRVPLILRRSFLNNERALIDVFEEVDAFLALEDDPTLLEVDQSYLDSEGDILLLEAFLNDDPSLPPPNQGNYLSEVRKKLKIYEAKSDKSLIDEPTESTVVNLGQGPESIRQAQSQVNHSRLGVRMYVNNLYQLWRAMLTLINQCLTGKTFGSDKPRHPVLQMLWGIVTRSNVNYVELLWEKFVQGIHTFFSHQASLSISSKKLTPYVIPYGRFTKLIIYHLGSRHNIHRIHESSVHIIGDDFLLGNLKFVPKGKKNEVFRKPILKELITKAFQTSPYYQHYMEMIARKPTTKRDEQKKTASKADKPKNPTPVKKRAPAKQTKPVKEKSTKLTPLKKVDKGKVKKVQKGKSYLQLVDEEQVHPEPDMKNMISNEGKDIATDEQTALSLLDLYKPKKKKTSADTDKTNSEGDTKILNVSKEQGKDVSNKVDLEENTAELDEGQAGSDLGKTLVSRPPPKRALMEED
nr:reverse transcriptase domain-containing protein [Tanacetum cinerariifolium]